MQDMDPGPTKILHNPEKGDALIENAVVMKRPVAKHGSKTREN